VSNIARPRDLTAALQMLGEMDDAVLLAGGTDLMVEVNFGHRRPPSIVALRRVAELQELQVGDTEVRLGAGVTYTRIENQLPELVPALAAASRTVGSPQIRNAATIGGNLGTASPAGDTLPVLAALEAQVHIATPSGPRTMSIDDFIVGPKRNALAPGEIIEAVTVPRHRGSQHFLKVGTRNAMVISLAGVALVYDEDARAVRVGLGSVGPRPLRARDAEEFISSRIDWEARRADPADVSRFADMVAAESSPITDVRGTAEYRRHCVRTLAARALTRSLTA
jgi:CO/xanthine dehydrogenase FAD-binding subunit